MSPFCDGLVLLVDRSLLMGVSMWSSIYLHKLIVYVNLVKRAFEGAKLDPKNQRCQSPLVCWQ